MNRAQNEGDYGFLRKLLRLICIGVSWAKLKIPGGMCT